jgi:hypothetical protein
MLAFMRSTRVSRKINAPRERVWRALQKAPGGMTCRVHWFDIREGGAFRISLTCNAATGAGKTTAHTDTCHGYFAELAPKRRTRSFRAR